MRKILPLSLVLLLAACSEEGTVAAKEAVGDAAGAVADAAGSLTSKFKDIDLSALSPDKMKELGGEAITFVSEKLGEIKDSATAEKVAGAVGPVLDTAGGLLKKLGDQIPNRAELKTKVDDLRTQFGSDEGVMKHLEPVLAKLSDILG